MTQFTYELDIPSGIVSDDTAYSSKGRWADCDGIRFHNGKPETLPGYTLNQANGMGGSIVALGFSGRQGYCRRSDQALCPEHGCRDSY